MEMELIHAVNVLEECQISPPSGSAPPMCLPLTFFDLIFLQRPPLLHLYFYDFHHSKTYFMNTILPNIKQSLSFTLQHFYPVAGNLIWPQESTKPQLVYKHGDAVSLTVAESDYEFYQLSGHHARDASLFTPLIPNLTLAADHQKPVPLLALQVTVFPDKGLCIGVTISHVATDGRTSNSFMKSWASVCKGDMSFIRDSSPFFDRSGLKFLEHRELKCLSTFKNLSSEMLHILKNGHNVRPVDRVRAKFVMSSSDIRKLKHWVLTRLEKENEVSAKFHVSSFVVTCAYVWVCWIKARCEGTDFGDVMEHLIVPIDVRACLKPPVPVTYFGNCFRSVDVQIKTSDLTGDDGLAIAIKAIGTDIQNFDLFRHIDVDFSYFFSVSPGQIQAVSSSPKFAVYETDFGWGKPKKVEMSATKTEQEISFTDCPYEEGAIEIGLVRKKAEMDAFANIFSNYIKFLS